MKTCRECGATKPLCEYYAHNGMRDGYLNKCKACVRQRVINHRQDNVERIRAYDRARGRTDRVRLRNAQYLTRAKVTDPEGFRKRRRDATSKWRNSG